MRAGVMCDRCGAWAPLDDEWRTRGFRYVSVYGDLDERTVNGTVVLCDRCLDSLKGWVDGRGIDGEWAGDGRD